VQQEEPSRFGFESTADDVLAEIDLSGKAAVVTGDSGGLGAESARALAARGAAVVLTARDESKAAGVVEAIHEETPDARVRPHRPPIDRDFRCK